MLRTPVSQDDRGPRILLSRRPRIPFAEGAAQAPLAVSEIAETPAVLQSARKLVSYYVFARAGRFAVLIGLIMMAAGCAVGIQYVMKFLVDAMAQPPAGNGRVWWILAVFLGLIAAENVFWRMSGWLGCRTTLDVGVQVRLDLFDFLAGQPMRYFAENLAGSLGQRVTATAGNLAALINTSVWRIVPPFVDFIGALIIFTLVDWHMAAALAGFVVIATAGLMHLGERGRPVHQAYAGVAGQTAGELIDVISNMWAVKAFSASWIERQRLASFFGTEARSQRASWMYIERTRLVHDVLLTVMASTMLIWALALWSVGRVSPGEVVVVSALTFRILHGSRDLALAMADGIQQFGFIEDTLRVIGQPRTVVDVPNAPALQVRGGEIEFRNVSFGYGQGKGREAVSELDFSVPPGQKVGIVGPSGAGKSTLIALLQRLHDAEDGELLIGGQPIRSVSQDSLRAAMAVVPQEISLFHRSVMENIRFGRPEASDDEVYDAARRAACDGFIRRLIQGYDTLVGERGIKLSGGQRQRIGIARAFLKNAPIIVLDEATSALDTETEMQIQKALLSLPEPTTVIAVAHRLSTVAAFDRVIVMERGRIVEDGPAQELREKGRLFERMWRLQTEGLLAGVARP
jgi:ATP-binding cassette subfamily B protein